MRPIKPLLGVCLLAALPNMAASQDIRDCPLDRVVFVDPWGGAEFIVDYVAGGFEYYCTVAGSDGLVVSDAPGENCRLLGDLHLIGTTDTTAEQMVATYSVIWGSPCCGWGFDSLSDFEGQDLAPMRADETQSLGDAGIYAILESDGYRPPHPDWPTANPMIPMICRQTP